MGDHRADYRAKDADRQRYVEAIEEAWVDGELGEQDRELRVARALTAETLDELAALTRDLQHQPAPVVVRRSQPVVVAADPTPPPTPPVAVPSDPGVQPDVPHGAMIGIAVAVVAVAVLGTLGFAGAPSQEAQGTSVEVPVGVWGDGRSGVERGFRMKVRDLREVAADYESRFGTREVFRVDYRPRSVVVQSPAGRSGDRVATWVWDGTAWTRQPDGGAQATATFDIAEVAPGPLVDNVRVAREALRVENGRFSRATVVVGEDGAPVVEIHVSNTFNETGFLTTTPAGEILRRDPYTR